MITADYDTTCHCCHSRIDEGDEVADMGDHYLCENCAPASLPA